MAQLKDTVVSGSLRATDSLLTTTLQTKILNAPDGATSSTYTAGTNGYFLKSSGSQAYWSALPSGSTSAAGLLQLTDSYTSTDSTKATTGKALLAALQTLDSSLPSGSAASKTLTALTITDGKMASATFTDINIGATQIGSGTLANARLPARLQEYHTSASNDQTTCGWFYRNSGSPFTKYHTSNTDFMGWINGYSTVWASELATDFRTNRLAVRNLNNGTWNSWRELAGNDDIVNEFSWTSDINYDSVTNTFTNTRTTANWASQVYSKHGFSDGCYISWKAVDATHPIMIGLNSDPTTDANWTGLDYAWYLKDGGLDLRESGTTISAPSGHTTYAAGDDFRIEYSNSTIRYYHNGVLCRSVNRVISGKLFADSTFYNNGSITDLRFGPINAFAVPIIKRTPFVKGTIPNTSASTWPQCIRGLVSGAGDAAVDRLWVQEDEITKDGHHYYYIRCYGFKAASTTNTYLRLGVTYSNGTEVYTNASFITAGTAYAYSTTPFVASYASTPHANIRFDTRSGTSSIGTGKVTYTTSNTSTWAQIYCQVPVVKHTYATAGDTTSTVTNTYTDYPTRFFFRQYSYAAASAARVAKYESYYLPAVNADRTTNVDYNILTTKNTVTVAQGGTGKASWTQWGVLYASASTTLANTAAGTAGYLLQSNATSAPSWIQATNANTANTIVKRDASGNFSAGTITASLSGNATTASGGTNDFTITSTGTNRARIFLNTISDNPNDLYFANNNTNNWNISSMSSTDDRFLGFYDNDNSRWHTILYHDGSLSVQAGLIKATNNSNTITIGSQNAGFCHITNSANVPFYFNKQVQADGGFKVYNSNYYWDTNGIHFDGKGACLIYNGPNDGANTVGGALNNLVFSSWYGVSFTTSCTGQTYTGTNAFSINCRNGYAYAARMYGAVWNDYAEYRTGKETRPGYCVTETPYGMVRTTKRLQAGCRVTSDTYGFAIGKTDEAETPIAVSGRVLVYPYRAREDYPLGAAVCSAPNGTVDIMTRDEIMMYPERIVGTVSEIPTYDIWYTGGDTHSGTEPVQVDGRIWIYVK